jgi:hypothetical protein
MYQNMEVIRESWNVVDAQWDALDREIQFLIMSLKTDALTDIFGERY